MGLKPSCAGKRPEPLRPAGRGWVGQHPFGVDVATASEPVGDIERIVGRAQQLVRAAVDRAGIVAGETVEVERLRWLRDQATAATGTAPGKPSPGPNSLRTSAAGFGALNR